MVRRAIVKGSARFVRRDDGSITVLGLFLMMSIIFIGGISVDLMRHEYARLQLQATLDNAVLAATDLDQRLDSEGVVRDYFAKAGLAASLDSVDVQETLNSRTVTAVGTMPVKTVLVRMLGVDRMDAHAVSTAQEKITDIEVSLVLDLSGSMNNHGRLGNLKRAAKQFVTTMLEKQNDDSSIATRVSISLIPYATQVAAGADILGQIDRIHAHDYSYCLNFAQWDFTTTTIDLSRTYDQTSNADVRTGRSSSTPKNRECRDDAAFQMRPFSSDIDALRNQIDSLSANGNTSIDIGVKWGAAMLDPTMRPLITELAAQGKIDSDFKGRPYDYDRNNTLKILVVMTDGENTSQAEVKGQFRDGMSDVWVVRNGNSSKTWKYSINDLVFWGWSLYDWWLPAKNRGDDRPDGNKNTIEQMSWLEVWETMPVEYHYDQMRNYSGQFTWNYSSARSLYDRLESNEKNSRLRDICDALRERNVIVYSIGLEIKGSNDRLMSSCAYNPNYYFDADGIEIIDVFAQIASSINQLRLIQ
ncbi:hypothetical protein EKE94_06955 [Mesobaculum littorinae]|uniref:Putative Flp pilus-assembly TadG-like N-terminal domain-containing protein n=1 Tax=Mesobaculum littorinae TaxID=2486419 RepID=A0A438AJ53_9RHOB|nr:pilus assembly protein TadG-related protein [Mesobaculum littorinae]RVV98645.1 hypothetical protein EKE94_06955 [Mesobaculum littorinae]